MSQLPLAIRRSARDSIDAPSSPFQQSLLALKEILGVPVTCELDLAILWNECEAHFDDKSTFVPYVLSHVMAFLDELKRRLEDEDGDSKWGEALLERVNVGSVTGMRVGVQVSHYSSRFFWQDLIMVSRPEYEKRV
jgi:hypothetical protein